MGVNGIYGLSGSGLDIESMVKVGMLSKQNEYGRMYKKETKQTWEKEAYSNVYSDLSTFNLTTLTQYKLQSNMNAMTASSSSDSVVKATANGAAAAMSHNVTINNMASNAYLISATDITRANSSATTEDGAFLKDVVFGSDVTVRGKDAGYMYDGNVYTSRTESNGMVTLSGGYDADGNELGSITVASSEVTKTYSTYEVTNGGNTTTVNAWDAALSFTIRDSTDTLTEAQEAKQKIKFTYDDLMRDNATLNDLASSIRKAGTNLTANYDSTNDVFSIYNSTSGADNSIIFDIDADTASNPAGTSTATLLNNLHLQTSKNGSLGGTDVAFGAGASVTAAEGENGEVMIDGRSYSNIKDNKITVSGVTYSLLGAGSSTVTVSQDTDKIVDMVKSFVEDYNKILDGLNDKYSEKKYNDYDPLTKSQENAMTEDQIKKWNEKAKSGMLNHSSIIGKIIDSMRESLTRPIDGIDSGYNSAYSIGIDTSTVKGHIKLDEDKLKKVLAADPD